MSCSAREAVKKVMQIKGSLGKVDAVYDFGDVWLVTMNISDIVGDEDESYLSGYVVSAVDWIVDKQSGKYDLFFPPSFPKIANRVCSDNPPQPVDKSLWED